MIRDSGKNSIKNIARIGIASRIEKGKFAGKGKLSFFCCTVGVKHTIIVVV